MDLDFLGNIVTIIQVVTFVMLLIGVYPSKRREESKNLLIHGFLSTSALVANLVTIFLVMLPVFLKTLSGTSISNFTTFPFTYVHAVVGVLTLSSSIIMVSFWFSAPLDELGCAKRWRLMKPTLAIWAFALFLGGAMHILGVL
jgi:multisubunit Na+/H+ antiporter MnhB subunit